MVLTQVDSAYIKKIEALSANALPALQTTLYDGWILRFSNGYTKRANSIHPLYLSTEDVQHKIDHCEHIYRQKKLNTVYKMTSAVSPPELDVLLENQGYEKSGQTSLQILPLQQLKLASDRLQINVFETFNEAWFNAFCLLNHVELSAQATLKKMLENLVPETCFLLSYHKDEVTACGLGVLEEDYLGLFDIVTHEAHRRKGYAQSLILQLLNWGKAKGAHTAYLQVVLENLPAIRLYSQLGFTEAYQYWYRIKKT
ncbi:GNAT superfamily N-acetyltransferase [Pullulanibacillus pueri]|uniref:Acetyltransferase, GNAT family protein n=1 Tax=Pullulanibacillus pueri TaxID=1437324 RepID=A0A8J3EL84_9BACL|nr:GNAT family N-acetyltransferase [Pullulanibacillus pueri]MBM7680804.1 GNAT superfamily N-acetyltransferase [Pullulanibacillus pueri]GGH78399.1 acetyltransferase, GNAT family protein [Pullulanibacillus pueri]